MGNRSDLKINIRLLETCLSQLQKSALAYVSKRVEPMNHTCAVSDFNCETINYRHVSPSHMLSLINLRWSLGVANRYARRLYASKMELSSFSF
jgi:hypothetical protein